MSATATATKNAGPNPHGVLTQEQQEAEIERRVEQKLKQLERRKAGGWLIQTALFGKATAVTESLKIHPHMATNGSHVEPQTLDMFKGQGFTSDERVADWCVRYLGYKKVKAQPQQNSLARTMLAARGAVVETGDNPRPGVSVPDFENEDLDAGFSPIENGEDNDDGDDE